MNAIDAKEITDMAKPTTAASATAPAAAEVDTNAMTAAEIAALEQAAEDERIAAEERAAEQALKDEAEAMRAAEADEATEALPPLSFDTSETGLVGADLTVWMAEQPRVLIFGGAGQGLVSIAAQPTDFRDWTPSAGGLEYSGSLTILTPEHAGREVADCVALADGPDGPVRAVSALGGPVTFAAGAEFKFGPGAFVFGR